MYKSKKKNSEKKKLKKLLKEGQLGQLYSEELGIKLEKRDKKGRPNKKELFKWFIASILFGHRISETIAKNTYRTFEKYNLLDPKKILKKGWSFLVNPIMRQGGYVRYDGKTSDQILKDCKMLLEKYKGDLNLLNKEAKNSKDLEIKLQEFYGIGPVTTNIFLRELRHIWKKANPEPLPIVKKIAKKLRIKLPKSKKARKTKKFVMLEAALIRLRKD